MSFPRKTPASRFTPWLAGLVTVAILVATLTPTGPTELEPWSSCIVCGSRGLADAASNVLLFLPLGVALALLGWSWARVALVAGLLSLCIELAQMYIPGRDPSFGDLLFNTIGGGVGALLVVLAPWWAAPPSARAARLALLAGLLALGVLLSPALLFRGSLPTTVYFGQWTAELGHLEHYRGRVLEAHLGGMPLPPHRISETHQPRERLRRREPVRVRFVAGPPPPALAPIVSIYDHLQQEILLIGANREDLVLRYRTRAAALRLDQPNLRLAGGLTGVAPGRTLELELRARRADHCFVLDGQARCGLGFSPANGWSAIYSGNAFPAWLSRLVGLGWIAALVAPVGFWARRRWEAAAGLAILIVGVYLLPGRLGLLPLEPLHWLTLGVGLLLGASARHLLAARAVDQASTAAAIARASVATQRSTRA